MIAHRSPLPGPARKALAGILLLGFLEAIPTLRAALFPDRFVDLLPPLLLQILSLGLLSALAAIFAFVNKSPWPRGRSLATSVLVGLGLFVIPALLIGITKPWLSSIMRAALFTLTPFFAVILEPYLTQRSGQQSRGALVASLASIAGTLLVLPVAMPDSLPATAAFIAIGAAAASIAASTCLAIRTLQSLSVNSADPGTMNLPISPFAAISTATAFFGLTVIAAFTDHPPLQWAALPATLAWSATTQLPALLLLFWLIPRVSAPRISTRFALSLLFPLLIGAPLLGSHFTVRDGSGIALMVAGTAYLLFASEDKPEFLGLSLR